MWALMPHVGCRECIGLGTVTVLAAPSESLVEATAAVPTALRGVRTDSVSSRIPSRFHLENSFDFQSTKTCHGLAGLPIMEMSLDSIKIGIATMLTGVLSRQPQNTTMLVGVLSHQPCGSTSSLGRKRRACHVVRQDRWRLEVAPLPLARTLAISCEDSVSWT